MTDQINYKSGDTFTSPDGKKVEIENGEVAYNGFFKMLRYRLRHSLFNGGSSEFFVREVMHRPNAVAVLLYDPKSKEVVLIKQFRIGALGEKDPWLEELVAGVIEPGELPEDVARRETQEETGINLTGDLLKIGEYFGSAGGLNEKTTVYFSEVNSSLGEGVHGLDSENEDILVVRKSVAQLFEEVANSEITTASLLIAALWLQKHLSSEN